MTRTPLALILALTASGLTLDSAAATTNLAAPGQAWAIIVNSDHADGCSFGVHLRNTELALSTLAGLGYLADHVVVVSEGADEVAGAGRLAGTWIEPGRGALRAASKAIRGRIQPGDELVVYLTGHGSKRGSEVGLLLGHSFVSASTFASAMAELGSARIVLIADVCFGGAFSQALAAAHGRVVAVTAADEDSSTTCVHFARPFWRALAEPANDANGDGFVSVEEAYALAEANFQRKAAVLPERDGQPTYLASRSLRGTATSIATLAIAVAQPVAVLAAR